ncbi:hypothetical protein FRC08_006887 [Ceratobasidium sp. 394]|nr:hypothetical protein FRC08_006887 [Ceratobasidium sp. 394]
MGNAGECRPVKQEPSAPGLPALRSISGDSPPQHGSAPSKSGFLPQPRDHPITLTIPSPAIASRCGGTHQQTHANSLGKRQPTEHGSGSSPKRPRTSPVEHNQPGEQNTASHPPPGLPQPGHVSGTSSPAGLAIPSPPWAARMTSSPSAQSSSRPPSTGETGLMRPTLAAWGSRPPTTPRPATEETDLDRESISSVSSTRRARPSPGSPVWHHLQALKMARQQQSPAVEATAQISQVRGTTRPSPARHTNSPVPSTLSSLESSHPTRHTSPNAQPKASSGQINLAQLRQYILSTPDVPDSSTDGRLDALMENPIHVLYQWVFVASLAHSIYRPKDPNKTLWVLMQPASLTITLRERKPFINDRLPTHIVGLHYDDEVDLSFLVWGVVERVEGNQLHVHIVIYDSKAGLRTKASVSTYFKFVAGVIRRTLPATHTIREVSGYMPRWTEDLAALPERDLSYYFCQLISHVVHDPPLDPQALRLGPPVDPVWPVHLVEDRTRALLDQIITQRLKMQDVLEGGGFVPECIYLHGDWYSADYHEDGFDEGPGWHQDDENTTAGPTDANNQHAALEPWAPYTSYIKAGHQGIIHQADTPTDLSDAGSHSPRWAPLPLCLLYTDVDPSTAQGMESMKKIGKSRGDHVLLTHGAHMTELTGSTLLRSRLLVEDALASLLASKSHQPTARLAFWQQLKASEATVECISFLTVHLWMSSLLEDPSRNTLFIDPVLVQQLGWEFEQDQLGLTAESVPQLWARQHLWPRMNSNVRLLVLINRTGLGAEDAPGWVLMEMLVAGGRVTKVDILISPTEGFDSALFRRITTMLIGALNCVLPRPRLVQKSSSVEQNVSVVHLPRPHTPEVIGLVMVAYLCGKMLSQDVTGVDVGVFRQSLCYYFDSALRPHQVDSSFPWPGLTDEHGVLLTDRSSEAVQQRRFSLAVNRQPSPFEVFPRRRSYTTAIVTPGPSAPFFTELAQPITSFPEDMLVGTSGRSAEELEKAILLGEYGSWPDSFPEDGLRVPEALSLDEFGELVHSVGGPESLAGQRLLLIGKHDDERIKLDWLKDGFTLNQDQLMASTDVDSLSLTTQEAPEFLEAGSYYAYPSRARSLTNRNELKVNVGGKVLDMHTCPNICIMSFGSNNQFRFLVFLPNCREKVTDRMWRNIPKETEMQGWFRLFTTSLRIACSTMPAEWQHAAEKTLEALPPTYRAAAKQATQGGGARSFVGHRIEPRVLNATFGTIRQVVESQPEFACFKGYFFHLCGINLKLATQTVHGREAENPLNYAFRVNSFIDWYSQNPNNMAVDVGFAINAHRGSVPEELKRGTLLIRHDPLRELLRPGFNQPQRDRYCHSYVISGLRAVPAARVRARAGVIKVQAYHKDMVLTYKHRDKSVGTNFTVNEALGLGHRDKFESETRAFQEIMADAGSYGIRLEWRLTPWAANRLMLVDPQEILGRLVQSETIICHPTVTVASHKIMLSKGWAAVINRQRALPTPSRRSPEVALLTSVLAYWLKGLVKRPDDMSATTDMVNSLSLASNAKEFGLPSLRSRAVQADGLRVSYTLEPESFKIMDHVNVIRPGGNRIKTSKALRVIPPPDPLLSPPPTPARALPQGDLWSQDSQTFLDELVNVYLPRALWARFPDDRKAQGTTAAALRRQALKRRHWAKVVEPLNEVHEVKGKFRDSINQLFPPNWTAGPAFGDFKVYNNDFLQRIRDHVAVKQEAIRASYSAQLRAKIGDKLTREWDYLPSMHAHKIWTFNPGKGTTRTYRICLNDS